MSTSDKITLGSLAIIGCVVAYLAYRVNDTLNNPDIQAGIKGTVGAVTRTVDSAQDIARAIADGNAPPTGTAGSLNTNEMAPLGYLESVHDLVAHPVDSFKVLFGF